MSSEKVQTKKLGDICEIQLGKTPSRSFLTYWDKEKVSNNVWLSISDLVNGDIVTDSTEYISDTALPLMKVVPKGALMVSFKLTLGRTSIAGRDLFTNEAIAAILKLDSSVSQQYLRWFFEFFDWQKATDGDEKLKGRTFNKAKLKELKIPIPPLPEQERIVAQLDAAFAAIDKAKANVERNLHNAKELFQSKLNEVFSVEKEGWVEKRLGEIMDVRDGTHDSPKYHETGFPLVTSKNLRDNGLNLTNVKYISKADYDSINARSRVNKGDILFAMIGTIGMPTIVDHEPEFAIKNVALFKCSEIVMGEFVRYFLLAPITVDKMMSEAKGTTQQFVGLGYLRNFPICFPSLIVQTRLVNELNTLNQSVKQLESHYTRKLIELETLKKSVLERAFRGEI